MRAFTWMLPAALLGVLSTIFVAPLVALAARSAEAASIPRVAEMMQRAEVQDLLGNSLLLALLTTIFSLLLGIPVALCLGFRRVPFSRCLEVATIVPLLIPAHIHAISWARVIGDRGWLTKILLDCGIKLNVRMPLGDPATDPLLGHVYPGPAWILATTLFPIVVFAIRSGIPALDPDALAAAQLSGRGRWARLRLVLGWLALRIAGGATLVFLLALASYPVVSLLDTPVLIQKIFFTFSQVDQGGGLLMSLPLLAVAAVLVAALSAIDRRIRSESTRTARFVPEVRSVGAALIVLSILTLSFGIPFAALLREAGPIHLFRSEPDNYQRVVARVAPAFADSFLITGLVVLAALPLAFVVGRRLAADRRGLVEWGLLLLLAIPSAVVAAALLSQASEGAAGEPMVLLTSSVTAFGLGALGARKLRQRLAFGLVASGVAAALVHPSTGFLRVLQERGCGLPVIGLLALFLPLAVRMMRSAFAEIDPGALEAAKLSGVSEVKRQFRIGLPFVRSALLAAGLLVYVMAFTELSASLLLLRPSWQSVQVRIFNMVHYQRIEEVAALCVLVVVAAAAPLLLAQLLRPVKRRPS